MPRVFICTVGTSLLTNRDSRPWSGWSHYAKLPLPEPASVDEWLRSSDPVAASAETNTLRALGVDTVDRLVLLHTDTPEGRFCSERLATFYNAVVKCEEVSERCITAMGYQAGSFAQRGLRSLVQLTIRTVRECRDKHHHPIFCATGGFKAEIAYLNVMGALLDVEVCYIHEQFREIVRLPRLPLMWDAECVVRHRDFFEWIDSEPRASAEVEGWLNGRAELRPLVEDDADGHTYLSAAGTLLYQAALDRQLVARVPVVWPAYVPTLPEAKSQVSKEEHHRPKGWERFVSRLCEIGCVTRVSYDPMVYGGSVVKVLDPARGIVGVRFVRDTLTLPLRVETTAVGVDQCELVAEYILSRLK